MTDLKVHQWERVREAGEAEPDVEHMVLSMLRAYHEEVTREVCRRVVRKRKERAGDSYAPSNPEYPAPKHPSPSRQAAADAGEECPSCGGDEYLQPCPGCNGDASGVELPWKWETSPWFHMWVDQSEATNEVAFVKMGHGCRYLDDSISLSLIHALIECRRRKGLDTPMPGKCAESGTVHPALDEAAEVLGCDREEVPREAAIMSHAAGDLDRLREEVCLVTDAGEYEDPVDACRRVARERDEAVDRAEDAEADLYAANRAYDMLRQHNVPFAIADRMKRERDDLQRALRHIELALGISDTEPPTGADRSVECIKTLQADLLHTNQNFEAILQMQNEAVERAKRAEARLHRLDGEVSRE